MENNVVTKVSDIIDKPLFASNDAVLGGKIISIGFDKHLRYAKCLIIDTLNENDLTHKFVQFKDIINSSNDAIAVKYSENIKPSWDMIYNKVSCPYQKKVYNQDGKFIGILTDIFLSKSKVCGITIDQKEFDHSLVHSISDEAVCINDSGKKILYKSKTNAINTSITKNNLPKVKITNRVRQNIREQELAQREKQQDYSNNFFNVNNMNTIIEDNDAVHYNKRHPNINSNKLKASKWNNVKSLYVNNPNDSLEGIDNQSIDKEYETQNLLNTKKIQNTKKFSASNINYNYIDSPTIPTHIDIHHTEVTKTPKENQAYDKYYFLKNKELNSNIYDNLGNIIFDVGTIITDEVINVAKLNNRLVHLVLYSS